MIAVWKYKSVHEPSRIFTPTPKEQKHHRDFDWHADYAPVSKTQTVKT